jgi:hypothetical protein
MTNSVFAEFSGLILSDKRREARASLIVDRLAEDPKSSFPEIFPEKAELEAFYRFIESPYVEAESLYRPHIAATIARANAAKDLLVLHDTTEFIFGGERKNLSKGQRKLNTSFLGHFSLAFDFNGAEPLGILEQHTWVRQSKTQSSLAKAGAPSEIIKAQTSELTRWVESVEQVDQRLGNPGNAVHVCDSEIDDYKFQSQLLANGSRFVIRGCHDRHLQEGRIREHLLNQPLICERAVRLSRRTESGKEKRNPKREERQATLEVRSGEVNICRPDSAELTLPKTLKVNVVYIHEPNPPKDCLAVEWILLTNEPVANNEQALRVVDIYRSRWVIEEYFKSLKTGCAYESRQLESYETLQKCLALFVPIAWLMLRMRHDSRSKTPASAEEILPEPLLKVLRLQSRKTLETSMDTLMAVAGLGGHIKNNGAPGYLVLWRGFRKLAMLYRGYLLATHDIAKMSIKRCDQS